MRKTCDGFAMLRRAMANTGVLPEHRVSCVFRDRALSGLYVTFESTDGGVNLLEGWLLWFVVVVMG